MKRAIVTPFTLAPGALGELKDWLGITTGSDDAQLGTLLRASIETCEQFTGQMPLQQLCEEVLSASAAWQVLSVTPVQAITQVEGIPAEGSRFVLAAGAYEIELDADGPARVRVTSPGSAGRIAVRFTAGLAASWSALPETLRHGVIRLAAHHYRAREDSVSTGATPPAAPPAAIAALWRPWRRMRLA
ncbi:MAG TPA: hypothetical protein VFV30_10215 [Novosphingobium sp.]|nr:hypothetical protein [Novosphingobium sp.]